MSAPKHVGKSNKSQERDRPSHSSKLHNTNQGKAKKGGAGGAYTWGKAGDEIKSDSTVDPRDPNYEAKNNKSTQNHSSHFSATHNDLARFKKAVRAAAEEFHTANDKKEFQRIVQSLNLALFHQVIPAILVKDALDHKDEDRDRVVELLAELCKNDIVSPLQMVQGFRRVYNQLDDISIDVPLARQELPKIVQKCVKAGCFPEKEAKALDDEANALSDPNMVQKAKADIKEIARKYFGTADVNSATKAVQALPPYFHFEVIKQFISTSLDRSSADRELASKFIAHAYGEIIKQEAIVKAFTILLERVEDLYLDVPDIQHLLSFFVARAVHDEALPPAFLVRVDLAPKDLGMQVIEHAGRLLKEMKSAKIEKLWVEEAKNKSHAFAGLSPKSANGATSTGAGTGVPGAGVFGKNARRNHARRAKARAKKAAAAAGETV